MRVKPTLGMSYISNIPKTRAKTEHNIHQTNHYHKSLGVATWKDCCIYIFVTFNTHTRCVSMLAVCSVFTSNDYLVLWNKHTLRLLVMLSVYIFYKTDCSKIGISFTLTRFQDPTRQGARCRSHLRSSHIFNVLTADGSDVRRADGHRLHGSHIQYYENRPTSSKRIKVDCGTDKQDRIT